MNATAASPKTAPIPLADLVRAAQQGDRDALSQLYESHRAMLRSVVLRILQNDADTDDVLQESFVQIWQRIGDLNSPHSFSGWIRTVARRKGLDFLKSKSRRRELGDPECLATPDSLPSPEETQIRKEQHDRLRRAIDKLPETDRDTVTWIYFEGRTFRSISERTAVPIGTLKRRAHTARQRLMAMLVDRD